MRYYDSTNLNSGTKRSSMSEGEKDLTTKKREQQAVPKKKEQKLRKKEGTYLSPDGNQPAAPAAPGE